MPSPVATFVASMSLPTKKCFGEVGLCHRTGPLCNYDTVPATRARHNPTRRTLLKHMAIVAASVQLSFLSGRQQALADKSASSHRVYFDVSIAGRPQGRITVHLFSSEAPTNVDAFEKLAAGTLRSRTGRTAGYRYSQASRVISKQRVYLGRLNQIDSLNQSPGTPQRQQRLVEFPVNSDANQLSHDRPGLISMEQGGSFEFSILSKPDTALDATNVVIGEVIDGMDIVEALANVPINRKTIRDGYRNIGKAIGDARANVQDD